MVKRILYVGVAGLAVAALILGIIGWKASRTAVINIEWETASEIDTVGFDLFRSVNSEDGFVKINPEIVPAADDPLMGSSYSYSDANVIPGETYYYILEDIDTTGARIKHGPIEIRAVPSGKLEMFLSVFLLAVCIFLFYMLKNTHGKAKI